MKWARRLAAIFTSVVAIVEVLRTNGLLGLLPYGTRYFLYHLDHLVFPILMGIGLVILVGTGDWAAHPEHQDGEAS